MSHSRRSSRSGRSVSGRSGDPFNDANYLESAYPSSEDDITPLPARRTIEILPRPQITVPSPAVLATSPRRETHQRGESSDSSHNERIGRRGSTLHNRQEVASPHAPPPVSLQTRRRSSLIARRASRFAETGLVIPPRPALSSSDGGYSSSDPETLCTEWPSDLSDTASMMGKNLGHSDGSWENKDPFATPRKGSMSGGGATVAPSYSTASTPTNNRESVRTVDNDLSTVSSQLSPFALAQSRENRRQSEDVDPASTRRTSVSQPPQSPTKHRSSPQKRLQPGHKRNFSRPFNSSASEASESGSVGEDEMMDKVTSLPHIQFAADRRPTAPTFDPAFTFGGDGRRESIGHSLDPEAQKRARKEAEEDRLDVYKKEGMNRRKSSCVLVNRRKSIYTIEEEKVVRAVGKKRLKWTKWAFIAFFFCMNGACTAISWLFEKYWFVFAPVILLGNCLNTLMVLNLARYWLWRQTKRLLGFSKPPVQPKPTTIAMVLACYCENYDELMATLESLHDQENVEQHKKVFVVIVDGQVKGKGMSKTTDRILVEDIFKPEKEEWFPVGYESWDGVINGIYACAGEWRGVPYVCLVKKRNLGKRDGLILVRALLYKYEFRYENPVSNMGDEFFRWFCDFSETLGIDKYEWLVGVDADTTFNRSCIYNLHYKCIQDERLIGCSGLIQVGFRTGNWNLWNLYQNAEYIRAQCLRRMHQAKGTGKVSCLPGACQIIKICEETCGDKILIDTFGHIPDPKDHMIHQVRALAGEDRNYICIIFKHYPKAITTMSMDAIAFTDPPNGVMVFLSQRKRWTLSTTANDMLISSKNAMNWFERICSLADMLVWCLPIFVAQTIILFIRACIHASSPVFILSFASVTIIPLIYGLIVTYWGCRGWRERLQYLAGFFMVVLMGQMITPVVIIYAIWHMDDFSWGKTREVEDDGTGASKPAHSD